jgi:hypothetical protein
MSNLSSSVEGHLVTLSGLNGGILIDVKWSKFVDNIAQVQVVVEGHEGIFSGSAENSDPNEARIMAIDDALKDSGLLSM